MRKLIRLALLLATVAGGPIGELPAAEIEMGEFVEYPHAGVSVALPVEFESKIPQGAIQVANAVKMIDGKPEKLVVLSAAPVEPRDNPKSVADMVIEDLKRNPAVENVNIIKETKMPVGGMPGVALLLY